MIDILGKFLSLTCSLALFVSIYLSVCLFVVLLFVSRNTLILNLDLCAMLQ
jgi:hypothetical protein